MQIPINFRSAELHTQSLCMTITDSVVEAGADAEATLPKLRQARAFAELLTQFLQDLERGVAGETPISDDDSESQSDLRAALAAARSKVTELPVRGVTDSRFVAPEGAA